MSNYSFAYSLYDNRKNPYKRNAEGKLIPPLSGLEATLISGIAGMWNGMFAGYASLIGTNLGQGVYETAEYIQQLL
jgi:hypothetical protein